MAKPFILIALFLFGTQYLHAQYIKIDNGIVYSKFNNSRDLEILSTEEISSYSGLIGVDYLEKNWFYFSSQIGYTKIGGKETNPGLVGEYHRISESKSFIHLNTTFRPYISITKLKVFAGVGPYFHFLTGSKNFDSSLYSGGFEYNSVNIGGKSELGFTFDMERIRLGVMGTYLFNLSPSAESESLKLYSNAYSVMFTVGYKIM